MPAKQDIQQCIQQCQQTATQLRTMSKTETDMQAKNAFTEAAHHLDLCVAECQFAAENA